MKVKQLLEHLKSVPESKTIDVDIVSDDKRSEYWVEKVEANNEVLIIIEYWVEKDNQQMTVQQLLQELKQVDLFTEIKMINPFGEKFKIIGFKDNRGAFITIYADYWSEQKLP